MDKSEKYDSVYEIYKSCFPTLPMTEEIFTKLLEKERNTVIPMKNSEGIAVGFSLISGNAVRLLCVRPEYRNKHFGSMLLRMSEGNIAGYGHRTAVIGGADSPFFVIGAPEDSGDFFKKFDYTLSEPCYEMKLPQGKPESMPPVPENIRLGFFEGGKDKLIQAVKKVEEDWVRYFSDDTSNVFCGYDGDEIVSFCIIDTDDKCLISRNDSVVGSIGCVGTVPDHRRRGIGLAMVASAAKQCRKAGCGDIFIHYTYYDKWYGKLGAEPVLTVHPCEKLLPDWGIRH